MTAVVLVYAKKLGLYKVIFVHRVLRMVIFSYFKLNLAPVGRSLFYPRGSRKDTQHDHLEIMEHHPPDAVLLHIEMCVCVCMKAFALYLF